MALRGAGPGVANYRLINFKKGIKNNVNFINRNNLVN